MVTGGFTGNAHVQVFKFKLHNTSKAQRSVCQLLEEVMIVKEVTGLSASASRWSLKNIFNVFLSLRFSGTV